MRFFLTVFAQRRRLRRVQPSAYPTKHNYCILYPFDVMKYLFSGKIKQSE